MGKTDFPIGLQRQATMLDRVMAGKEQRILLLIAVSAFIFVFLKNAWVGEDAYIIFRSVEQLFAGNGPRWNPHERIQVFTSPLWYGILSVFRLVSADVFLNAIIASATACMALFIVLVMVFQENSKLLLAVMMLVCSSAFFDYTTSGLENPVAYLLIALFFLQYQKLSAAGPILVQKKPILMFLVCFGLIVFCRLDLFTLVLIPTVYICWHHRRALAPSLWPRYLLIALSPVLMWSIFAIFYYGSILPNTFFAKIPSNIDGVYMWKKGIIYLLVSLQSDTITLLLIGTVVLYSWLIKNRAIAALGIGIAMNLAYVVWIGGDFMQGRFLSYAYLMAILMMLGALKKIAVFKTKACFRCGIPGKKKRFASLFVGSLLYMLFYPHTPLNSPFNYQNGEIVRGIDDERGYFFKASSLWHYISKSNGGVFPEHVWCELGYAFRMSPQRIQVMHAIGYFGYWAGTEKIIIDPLGLGDALLARLPYNEKRGAVGHFYRDIPAGYLKSLLNESNQLEDPELKAYFSKIQTVTQGNKLFSLRRIKTIAGLFLGRYNHYIHSGYTGEPPEKMKRF